MTFPVMTCVIRVKSRVKISADVVQIKTSDRCSGLLLPAKQLMRLWITFFINTVFDGENVHHVRSVVFSELLNSFF